MSPVSFRFSITVLLIFLLFFATIPSFAAEDCWLDIFDANDFQGAKVRIQGPAELPNLRELNGENWGNRIDSLIVGPKAQVLAFVLENYQDKAPSPPYHGDALKTWKEDPKSYSDKEITFGARHKEHHLGELFFHRDINSLKIKCVP